MYGRGRGGIHIKPQLFNDKKTTQCSTVQCWRYCETMFAKGKSFWRLLSTIWNENMAKKKVVTEIFCRVIQSWGWYIYDLFLKKEKVHLLKKSHQRLWMMVSGSLILIKCYGSLLFFSTGKVSQFRWLHYWQRRSRFKQRGKKARQKFSSQNISIHCEHVVLIGRHLKLSK